MYLAEWNVGILCWNVSLNVTQLQDIGKCWNIFKSIITINLIISVCQEVPYVSMHDRMDKLTGLFLSLPNALNIWDLCQQPFHKNRNCVTFYKVRNGSLFCWIGPQMLRPSFKNSLAGHLTVAHVFTDFHVTSYSGFQVKQSMVALLMFCEQYFLLCSGERRASISVLPVYGFSSGLCVRLYCEAYFHYGEAHNGLHQNNSAFNSEDVVCLRVTR